MKSSLHITTAIAAAIIALPVYSQNIKSIEFRSGKQLEMGVISELVIAFEQANNSVNWCGLQVRWGDGQEQTLRIGDDQYKTSPALVPHTYTKAGNFRVDVEGRPMIRGLRSAVGCDGRPVPVDVVVVDKQAQAEAQRLEAERRLKDQQAEIERQKLDAERQRAEQARLEAEKRQREFAEKELELKRRELQMKEEMLKREEEMRRRPASSAPAAAPRPAAPAPSAPSAVKPADGF